VPPAADLKRRLDAALRAFRLGPALDLARQLFERDRSPANRDQLRNVLLGRTRQLYGEGQSKEAIALLRDSFGIVEGDDHWAGRFAEELARCGDPAGALTRLPAGATAARQRVLAHAADVAIERGPAGHSLLSEEIRGAFDHILAAFAHYAAGEDNAARERLQAIGLQSPFLEWKMLLRGLMAYSARDDARALENWQRLTADRLPARLAAPLRAALDPGYRQAQPPTMQALLRQAGDRLQGVEVIRGLRAVQRLLDGAQSLGPAFRQAELLLPALRREFPEVLPRLANAFYWAAAAGGDPDDVRRYARIFGKPADDPLLARLEALSLEQRHRPREAHKKWQQFEQSLATNRAWPADQSGRARALVWCRLGRMTAELPHAGRPLKPGPAECYRQALELAPDLLEAHEALIALYRDEGQTARLEAAGRRLLEHFPDNAPTLELLAGLSLEAGQAADALALLRRALAANPLERRLRVKVAVALRASARAHADRGDLAAARDDLRPALDRATDRNDLTTLCLGAACAFKADDATAAEELLSRGKAVARHPLAVAYHMLAEATRLKSPRPVKARFEKEFKAALADAPSGAAAVALAEAYRALRQDAVEYLSRKTHEKKLQGYVDAAIDTASETELERLGEVLHELGWERPLLKATGRGRREFPANPSFPFHEALTHLDRRGGYGRQFWKVEPLLEEARRLAERLPRDPRRDDLLKRIAEARQRMAGPGNLSIVFRNVFDELFGDDD
jgi:tetratricopeptide (TPR) repeat protein